jgi:acylphosphatase
MMDNTNPPAPLTEDWQRFRAMVYGRVQGVNYRNETLLEAQSLGLVGYVRNCWDRTVEVVAEGPAARLSQLLAWLHRGPSMAHVTRVELTWQTPQHDMDEFEVRG